MVWKPKERELTKEEALLQAKKELTPYWIGAKPMFAALRPGAGQKAQLFPLDEKFAKESWLILLCDPFSFEGSAAQAFFKEWKNRYSDLGIEFLVIFTTPVRLDSDPKKTMETVFQKYFSGIPVIYDYDRGFMELFDAREGVSFVLFSEGKLTVSRHEKSPLISWYGSIEKEIQNYLRKKDPGLALLPEYASSESVIQTTRSSAMGAELFKAGLGWSRTGKFTDLSEGIEAKENGVSISFKSLASCIGVVARPVGKMSVFPKIFVEMGGRAVFERFGAENLQFDDSGSSYIQVSQAGLFLLAKGLPSQEQQINLIFQNAGTAPVILYRVLEGRSPG